MRPAVGCVRADGRAALFGLFLLRILTAFPWSNGARRSKKTGSSHWTNVNFVQVTGRNSARMVTWERGAGKDACVRNGRDVFRRDYAKERLADAKSIFLYLRACCTSKMRRMDAPMRARRNMCLPGRQDEKGAAPLPGFLKRFLASYGKRGTCGRVFEWAATSGTCCWPRGGRP